MADSQEDTDAKIDELTATLQAGETSTSIDGTTTSIDLDAIRKERQDLISKSKSHQLRRPRLSSVNLGGLMG